MENGCEKASKALLVRAKYPYGKSQTWIPMDLHKVAAQLETGGISTDVVDLNLEEMPIDLASYDHVGIGVIGAPYIPSTREIAQHVIRTTGKRPLIGGPCIGYLSPVEFASLYGDSTQVKNTKDLSLVVGKELPSVYDTSVAERIRGMEEDKKRRYLQSEMSFFVSQGCKFACHFCAAERTRSGSPVAEKFSHTIPSDLEALCESAVALGVPKLTFYLTSLDLFQTPDQFLGVLRTFAQARAKYQVDFKLRGLSRTDSFLEALDKERGFYEAIPAAGLSIVGFGVDGTTEKVWRSQRKGITSLSNADNSFKVSRDLGITPEALMVMGFHDQKGKPVETKANLRNNVEYSTKIAESMGVVSRPHVAKDMVPGNSGWTSPIWAVQRQRLLDNPTLFKNLDFVALASELTHPEEDFRDQVNDAYLEIIRTLTPSGHCVTSPLMPYTGSPLPDQIASTINMLVPFDR